MHVEVGAAQQLFYLVFRQEHMCMEQSCSHHALYTAEKGALALVWNIVALA